MYAEIRAVLLTSMLVLAGCGGTGGGGGSEPADVTLRNATALAWTVGPNETASVNARVGGGGIDHVNLITPSGIAAVLWFESGRRAR